MNDEFAVASSAERHTRSYGQACATTRAHTIAAFLNTSGGTLLIGVKDSGTTIGIEADFPYLKPEKQHTDGWLSSLQEVIIKALSAAVWGAIHVSLVRRGQETVTVVHCPRRSRETWHLEDGTERFYIRRRTDRGI